MRIAMTLQHEWKIDSRVIREAEALVGAGHQVLVVCRSAAEREQSETQNGVVYRSLPRTPSVTSRQLLALFLVHLRVYSLWLGSRFAISWRCGLRETWRALRLLILLIPLPILGAIAKLLQVLFALPVRGLLRAVFRGAFRLARPVTRLVLTAENRAAIWSAYQRWLELRNGFQSRIRARISQWISRVRTTARSYVEPLVHLNDYAVSCAGSIVEWRPDIVHIHDMVCMSGGYLAARKLGVPFVYDAHELETHTNYHLGRLTWLFIDRYQYALIRRAAKVITVCDSIADWLSRKYHIERPTVILNTPALDRERNSSASGKTLRGCLGLTHGEKLAVYVGAVTIDRGLEHCVEALQFAPDIHLALVGARYSVTEELLKRLADQFAVAERFHLVDPVPGKEVVSFIQSADFSVIPIQNVCLSYYYCMPNKLLESVVGGLPVAIARLKELRSFLDRFPVGIAMDESSPESIALAMRVLAKDAAKYRPTPEQISAIVASYGWESQRAKLVSLYRVLAEQDSSRNRKAA
ncbi:glycosyltransferase family 4 protein [Accumulibacter sp.]|uniref:glycosyltransferase family 4 protein n=1 Tax=Accumulibacter sp. TaxID=2053492 RepID=UPI002BC334E2|nr:glycosyltransferase family 4 protein [Accumulibacter sp.]HNC19642.1 glycosyltransferase family 4 protein [Accumulibacter sp.]